MTTDENTIMEMLEQETDWKVCDYLQKDKSVVNHDMHNVTTFWRHFDNTLATYLTDICDRNNMMWFIHPWECTRENIAIVFIPSR